MITELTFIELLLCQLMLTWIIGGNVTFQLEATENKGVIFFPFQIHGTLSSLLGPWSVL